MNDLTGSTAGQCFDRLAEKIQRTKSHLCVGIDPELPSDLQPSWLAGMSPLHFAQVQARLLLQAAHGRAPVVKFQSAYFEACGGAGFDLLGELIAEAQSLGLLVIVDAKRGDISSTMSAYGRAVFNFLRADIVTVTPYMGLDVLKALEPWLLRDKAAYVVWASSNPSSTDIQELPVQGGSTVQESLLDRMESSLTPDLRRSLGLVCGATRLPSMSPALRAKAATWPLLIPGIGEQGGSVSNDLKELLKSSPLSVVNLSRGLSRVAAGTGEAPIHSEAAYGAAIKSRVSTWAAALSL